MTAGQDDGEEEASSGFSKIRILVSISWAELTYAFQPL